MHREPAATCLTCMGTGMVADQPCALCSPPDAATAMHMMANPTNGEQQAELRRLEREALDATCAIAAALQLGLISFAGLSQVQGKALVELSVIQGGKPQMMRFPGANVVDAFIEAGKEVHAQLLMVHEKRPIPWYITSVGIRQKVRQGQAPKIITGRN